MLGQKFGRKNSTTSVRVSSVMYASRSRGPFRHAKYVYDCVNPSFASRYIRFGRVNASARKITSGCDAWISPITHSQNRIDFVCGLSTRKTRTPRSIQNSNTRRSSAHSPSQSSHSKSSG